MILSPPFSIASAGAEPVHKVEIKGFAFVPNVLTVKVGDEIEWINNDIVPHTASADDAGWDSGDLLEGQSARIKMTQVGEYSYMCRYHPKMRGTIIVEP